MDSKKTYILLIKSFLDILTAMILLLITFPLMLLAITTLAWKQKGKVWFTQVRPGKDGKPFRLIKLKTMTDDRDALGNLLPDEQRLTAVGSFIRKTSLDEIPQLLNVLKRDMSLVGPRPLLMEYLPLYNAEQMRRHAVKPGITGWAQVNGRNALGWEEKFQHDIWYVDHISMALDIKILWLTLIKVFKREGISGGGSITMTKFEGNNKVDITSI